MQPFRSCLRVVLTATALLCALAAPAAAQSPEPSGAYSDEGGHLDQGGTAPGDLPLEFTRPENERQVRALLESQGYADIRNIQMDGEVITADATRNGEPQQVVIRLKTESQDGG